MEKYKVLIAEDEEITLNELLITIDWESLGLEVVATVQDGIKGEELIKELSPDIVISDIRLPGQDGLEMLAKCDVGYSIIISGHTDFTYAKKAIRIGVTDYLEKPYDDEELKNSLKSIVQNLNEERKLRQNMIKSDDIIELPSNFSNHLICLSIDFIHKHYKEQIGLQEVAENTRTSENHLSTLFREITGINFLQYLNGYRINKASQLLKTTNLNISEVAEASGFPTPSYFTKIFRRFSGLTPTQFRDSVPLEQREV